MTSPLPFSCRSKIPRSLSVVSLMCAPVVAAVTVAACGSSDLDPIESASPAETTPDGGGGIANGTGNLDSGGTDATRDATTPVTGSDAGHATDGGGTHGASTCKRGIASTTTPPAALAPSGSSPGVTWWYDWSNEPADAGSAFEFVPMIWGSAGLSGPLPAGATYLLGFNEPNFKAQSNLTPTQAAADWPQVEALARAAGIPVVSPGGQLLRQPVRQLRLQRSRGHRSVHLAHRLPGPPARAARSMRSPSTGTTATCRRCRRTFFEGNTSTGGGLAGFVQFGKPIWVTELACSASSSVADNETYMKAAVPYLEGSPYVQRYSWFSAGPIPNALLVDSTDALTDLGKTYIALPQTSCD